MNALKWLLALAIVAGLLAGGVYLYVDRSQSMNALQRARGDITSLQSVIRAHQDWRIDQLEEKLSLAQTGVTIAIHHCGIWVDQKTLDQLQSDVEDCKKSIEAIAEEAAAKKKAGPTFN